MELAIDTSTSIASIALSHKGEVLAEMTWRAGHNHTVDLIPNVDHLLAQCGLGIENIEALIVAKGPGSFNGLRVGLATAKGLAFSLSVSLVGLSTLEVLAFPFAQFGLPICPILQAGRGEIATALFQMQNGNWTKLIAENVSTIDDLCSDTCERTVFCGEITSEQIDQLNQHLGVVAMIPHGAATFRRAGYLAELGWCKIEAGDFDEPYTLQPLYLKKPSITKPKRRDP
ncbi:MAG: tRNA (adenosine(37)-N6)-threonylcarbamoyltransferase complex dimerization subunit type 1 TsaB [Chloroflexota bacterium]|nr:tRNA (adenosine(37)-N6)-threonylcarbamoyltransferase complex dimerization subunit type 1 TsaB [Chloroflexota bacterium]